MSGEPAGSEGFAWIWVLWALNNKKKVDHIMLAEPVTLPVFIYFRSYCRVNMSKTLPGCQEGCYK